MPYFTWPESIRVWGNYSYGDSYYLTYYDWFKWQHVAGQETGAYEQGIDIVQKDLNGVAITYSATRSYGGTINGPPFSPLTTLGSATTKNKNIIGRGRTNWVTHVEKGKFIYREEQAGGGFRWKSSSTSTSVVDVNEFRVGKEGWPYETYIGRNPYGTYSGRQLANGYYTGIPTYSGSKTTTGYTILDKTELKQTTGTFYGIIDLAEFGPYNRPETQPKNFLWVPNGYDYYGGAGYESLLDKIGIGFYGFRDRTYSFDQNRPILSLAGINSDATLDNVSETTTTIPVSFIRATFTQNVNGKTTIRVEPEIMGSYWYPDEDEKTTTVTEFFSSYKNYNLPPIVDTRTKTLISVSRLIKTGELYLGFARLEYTKKGSTISNNNWIKTTYVDHPFLTVGGGGSSIVVENWGLNTHYYSNRNEAGRTLAKWPVNIGWLAQAYDTSKAGYYYTNPNSMYKDPTDLSTYLSVNYYKCFDGACVDIAHVANKDFFQTAKTANNTEAYHTHKQPRNAVKRKFGTDSLLSKLDYSTRSTSYFGYYYGVGAITGYPSYSKGPFGDPMSYEGSATYKDEYSNIKFRTVYANEGSYLLGPAQQGIGYFDYQEENDPERPPLAFQQSNLVADYWNH
jgi:hypothetical protein